MLLLVTFFTGQSVLIIWISIHSYSSQQNLIDPVIITTLLAPEYWIACSQTWSRNALLQQHHSSINLHTTSNRFTTYTSTTASVATSVSLTLLWNCILTGRMPSTENRNTMNVMCSHLNISSINSKQSESIHSHPVVFISEKARQPEWRLKRRQLFANVYITVEQDRPRTMHYCLEQEVLLISSCCGNFSQ